jgi:hypothetical protein
MDEVYAIPEKRNKAKNKKKEPYKRGGKNRTCQTKTTMKV